MDEKDLPPYSGSADYPASDDKKIKKEITLLHSPLLGTTAGTESSILLPPDTTLIRTWSGAGVDGIEFFSSTGATDLLGHRTGSPTDFRIPVGASLTSVSIRSGLWIDAIRYVATDGSETSWIGGPGGSETQVRGNIVGFIAHAGHDGGGGVLGQLGAITCASRYDYEVFYRETRDAGGVRADTSVLQRRASQSAEQAASGEQGHDKGKGREKSRFKWDTARLTGGRGLGVRWNHERHRVEIYQG